MDGRDYKYLFPYERVPANSRILIYGAGELGQDYLMQMQITHYCKVVAFADKNYLKYPSLIVPVIDPQTISEWGFDYVVIALRVAVAYNEIFRILTEQGVTKDKIICIFERNTDDICIYKDDDEIESRLVLACDKNDISIALLVTGGLGDHVIQKRLLMEIISLVPEASIDIYAIRHVDFLKHLYSDCIEIRNVIEDLGNRYNNLNGKYSFSMAIEACHYLRVDVFKEEIFNPTYLSFVKSIRNLIRETEREHIDLSIPVHVSNTIRRYRGLNAYSGFNYNGSFSISDKNVVFPITKSGELYYQKLGISNYYTVNYGSGECQDIRKVAKMWPLNRFEQVVALLKQQFPMISAVQLGAANAPHIKGTDERILGESVENVGSILKHSIFHLDIEGGLVHIATKIGTKCVVLFGPTVMEYYGYDENINICAGNCHDCWALYTDVNRCARDMSEPECMYSIKPELVAECIKEYLVSSGYNAGL